MSSQLGDTSSTTPEVKIGGPGAKGEKQWPQHNDYARPPIGEREPDSRYRAIYWNPSRWGSTDQVNSWWDGGEAETPEEAREYIEEHRPGKPYIIIKLTTTVEVVDASAMNYAPGDPYYGIELDS